MTQMKIAAFMTAPRYEAVYGRTIIDSSLRALGIPLNVSGGVFYGQCMQKMLNEAIAAGMEYAVTVDFDSVFTAGNLSQLLHYISSRDDIDAITAIQSRRGGKFPLFTVEGKSTIECDGTPFKVTTAHFGLTVLKLAKLATVEKPWFWSKPTEDGEWEQNKSTDDDIWFWRQWEKAGLSVWVDPQCRIGHLEEVISSYDDEMNHRFEYPKDWYGREFAK